MRIGRFELRGRERDDESLKEPPTHYMARLEELAAILAGIPWILAGGMALGATRGVFHRRHLDIDVAVPVDAFPAMDRAMRAAGYYLSTNIPLSLFGRLRCALHLPLRADGPLIRRRMRKLKYKDATGRRASDNLLAAIDPFPFRIEDGHWVTCDGRNRVAMKRPLIGRRVRTPGGHEIACLDLAYVAYFKLMLENPKHAEDLAIIGRQDQGEAALAGAREMVRSRMTSQPA